MKAVELEKTKHITLHRLKVLIFQTLISLAKKKTFGSLFQADGKNLSNISTAGKESRAHLASQRNKIRNSISCINSYMFSKELSLKYSKVFL